MRRCWPVFITGLTRKKTARTGSGCSSAGLKVLQECLGKDSDRALAHLGSNRLAHDRSPRRRWLGVVPFECSDYSCISPI